LAGAEVSAALIWAAEADAPAEVTVAQAAVVHWVQLALGTPPTTPGEVLDQSTARLGARMPFQSCAGEDALKASRARGSSNNLSFDLVNGPLPLVSNRAAPAWGT